MRFVRLGVVTVVASLLTAAASCSSSSDDPADAAVTGDDATTPDATASDAGNATDDAGDGAPNDAELSVSISPTSVSLTRDASAVVNVTITRAPDVIGPVDVSIDQLGVAFQSTPIQIAAGETTGQITLDALTSTPLETRSVPVTAKLGALAASTPLAITVKGASGDLDGAFGLGGRLKLSVGGTDSVVDMTLQPDGKLLVGATVDSTSVVLRMNPDGSLDPTFGTKGIATVPHSMRAIHLRADGKIVAAGSKLGSPTKLGITRLTSTGAPDATFATFSDAGVPGSMYVSLDPATTAVRGLGVQPDGKLVVSGDVTNIISYTRCTIARFNEDGTTDTGFGTNGFYESPDNTCRFLTGPIRFSNGSIYLLGTQFVSSTQVGVVARFTSTGAPDGTFGTSGFVTPTVTGNTVGFALLAGDAFLAGSVGTDVTISRFLSGGAVDTAFADGGVATPAPGSVQDFQVQDDGKIVAAATASSDFLVLRLTSSGALDTTFGGTGFRTTDFGGGNDFPRSVLVDPTTKAIYVGGSSNSHIAIAKYIP